MAITNPKERIIYQAPNGALELKSDIQNETIWANLEQIALLFGCNKSTISRHIKNIFHEGELEDTVVVAFFATTTQHGAIKGNMQKMHNANSDKPVEYYSLDIILAVGYRTNSSQTIAFRQ